MKKKTKQISKKMSLYLPQSYISALEVIRREERLHKSHQIEFGLGMYFEKYKRLLLDNGVDLWK